MKKLLKPLWVVACIAPTLAMATEMQTTSVDKVKAAIGPTTTQAQVNHGQVTLVSPRTGISYTFSNPDNRPMVLETAKVSAANSANANRIVATNPALSAASQEKAKQALLNEQAQVASN
jgi:hypothetical protein